jgi:hypothetical protein
MEFLNELKFRNEVLFYFGALCLTAAVICLILTWLIPLTLLGANVWLKPFKFLLSTAILTWSMAWYLHYLGHSTSVVAYAWGIIILLTVENVYIFVQAARGLTSHFNTSNSFYSGMWSVMAFAAVGIAVWTIIVCIPFFTQNFPNLPIAYLWGIRMGIIIFAIFSLEGLAMGARMAHSVGAADGSAGLPIVNWSKTHGDLRVAHFFGMHALQILPLLGFFVFSNIWTMLGVGILYLAGVTATFLQAIAGKPFLP